MDRKRALFVRVDRIGDLVLTLPVDQVSALADYDVTWCIANGLEFVVESGQKPREFTAINKNSSWDNFRDLLTWLSHEEFDLAVVFHAPWWVSLALWLADIPIRAGRKSQWYSYLFFNKGFRQRRSISEKHESEYNFELLSFALNKKIKERPFLELNNPQAGEILKTFQLESKSYFVVHPGMGGSARNVSTDFYIKVINELMQKSKVVITGTNTDRFMTDPTISQFKNNANVLSLVEKLRGGEIIAILQNAKAVLAPSTGVLHLAASTGVKTVGLYSPVLSQHANRWGPRGRDVKVFVPIVKCPGEKHCLFQKCDKFDCMDQIDTMDVIKALL